MWEQASIREGMQVYDMSNQPMGEVERVEGNQFFAAGHSYPLSQISRVEEGNIYLAQAATTPNTTTAGESMVIPIVEEQLQVGKREVETGGVRVTTSVTEKPVETQVNLHNEHINIERRPVNRPLTNADMGAFEESVIELTETGEEIVVTKQARVVEEVVIEKEVRERTETITDTVRRTEVEVEDMKPTTQNQTTPVSATRDGYETYDSDFQQDFQNRYAGGGATYEEYAPGYRYGYDMSKDTRYQGEDWNTAESGLQKDWEASNPGSPWDKVKDAVHYSWQKATRAV